MKENLTQQYHSAKTAETTTTVSPTPFTSTRHSRQKEKRKILNDSLCEVLHYTLLFLCHLSTHTSTCAAHLNVKYNIK